MPADLATTYESLDIEAELAIARDRADDHREKYLIGLVASEAAIRKLTGATSDEIAAALLWILADGKVLLSEIPRFSARIRGALGILTTQAVGRAYETLRRSAEHGASSLVQYGLGANAVRDIGLTVATEVAKNGTGGIEIADTIVKHVTALQTDLVARLRRAAVAEESITQQLAKTFTDKTAVNIGAAIHTEANGAYNGAVKEAFRTINARGLLWVLSANHTKKLNCACERNHGKVFDVDAAEIRRFPPHFACQCWLVPEL